MELLKIFMWPAEIKLEPFSYFYKDFGFQKL
ncbi:MAG: hypothetical protein FD181_1154 [Prolixibacteraceae bacterium]|nr:MAG: hypothetical protein FD181_1154 [Prolixibacteraceae bacterium]